MGRDTFRNKITSDELKSQINQDNIKMWERFLREKNTRCADTTIENYNSDLNIFFTWNLLHNDNKFFVNIKKIEFADFFTYAVSELQWKSARFGRMKSCLSSLSEFIVKYFDEEYPQFRNVILKAIESMPKNPAREKSVFTEDEINGLMSYLENDLENKQETCLLALAISSGARKSELLRFTTDVIDENNLAFEDMFLETTKKIKTKGRTKQGKMVHKYIIKDIFMPKYNEWLKERNEILKEKGVEHDYIFIKKDGTPATTSTLESWILKWDKHLDKPFYMHSLRHYTTTYLSRLGFSSDLIVEIFQWGSADMVKIYNDLSAKDKKWKELGNLKEALQNNKE